MAAFGAASGASSVIPWLLSAAQGAASASASNQSLLPYGNVSLGPSWLNSLQMTAATPEATNKRLGEKSEGVRSEPLDLSVKQGDATAAATTTSNTLEAGASKEQQTLQLAALTSLLPYWNALMQSQLAQQSVAPPLTQPAGLLALNAGMLQQLAALGRPSEQATGVKLGEPAMPELLKLAESTPKTFLPRTTDTPAFGVTSTLFGRGCKFDAFSQQLNCNATTTAGSNAPQPSPGDARHPSASNTAASGVTDAQAPLPLRSTSSHDDDAKYTDYTCSCGKRYSTVYHLARHLCESGHKPVNTRDEGNDIVKLVRGQDMWLNNETEQTRQILRCMQCKMSCSNLTELILHMVTTKHFAEIVYGSSSIAERYKFSECIFNDSASPTDDADLPTAPLLPTMVACEFDSPKSKPDPDADADADTDADIDPDVDTDAEGDLAPDSIDVIGTGEADRCDSAMSHTQPDVKLINSARRKRLADDEASTESAPRRRRITDCEDDARAGAPDQSCAARGQLLIIRERTPSPSPRGANALHSLSKFCESMRFEPASLGTTRAHTPWSASTHTHGLLPLPDCHEAAVRRDGEPAAMQVLVPSEPVETDKHDSSPLRSLEKFVQKNASPAAPTDTVSPLGDSPVGLAPPAAPATVVQPATSSRPEGRSRPQNKTHHTKLKVEKRSNSKRPAPNGAHEERANANGQPPMAILKKCVCEYCHKRFANKGQVRLHLSKNKCAVLLACFGHQRLQKMSASTLLSGSRAMVLNSLLYNAATMRTGAADADADARTDKAAEQAAADAAKSCNSQNGDLADRFAKYYEMARSLTGNSNFTNSS